MIALFIVVFIFVLYVLGVGLYVTNQMKYIAKKPDEEIINREITDGHFSKDELTHLAKTDVKIQSPYGYNLNGWFFEQPYSNHYIVICHGVTVNNYNSIKYAKLFHKKGWNVLTYEHRRHGKSGGDTTTYGYYEKNDLKAVMDWVKKKAGDESVIGIHGESMGAATMLLYAGTIEDGADFYIADCPYSSFDEQLAFRLKVEHNIPRQLVMPFAKLALTVREGYSFKDISPIQYIENIESPILFITSETDDYIPPQMTINLYKRKKGAKAIVLMPNGLHAMSLTNNREQYEEVIDDFFAEHNMAAPSL
ncbi:alpha/beta hydrolase [Bacillus sp. HMF5848]|uniref:alpha/beta hydrolase n=1 Tax=Bacillus sp. HMF5848 TaxID=2495421 RepID=UPI000F7AF665|nr:alpha/beta hydrolase [Bacillus sp. HMF5848]RSK27728.1 alpha/beta hydrolase [Bacillus sp. HMF5848]